MNYFIAFVIGLLTLFSCKNEVNKTKPKQVAHKLSLKEIDLNLDSTHFRGLHLSSSNNVWITGTDGVFVHYDGENWVNGEIDSARGLDLRDVHVLGDNEIITVSAGSPGKIFKTTDCGTNWNTVYSNSNSLIFLDGFDFTKNGNGVAFGDPMNGKIKLLYTENHGNSWQDFDTSKIPNALAVEAGFAASGTGIKLFDSLIYIGLGGEKARFMRSEDFGQSWQTIETPMLHGNAGKGIYTIAFKDELNGVAAGGNWENHECDSSKLYTNDGGLTWYLSEGLQHYRSCVIHLKNDIYMSTGTSGTDISYDNGKSWQFLDSVALNALQFDAENNIGFGVGSFGKIYEFKLEN